MKYKVISLLLPNSPLFEAKTEWECRDFISERYGNGLAAFLCQIKRI